MFTLPYYVYITILRLRYHISFCSSQWISESLLWSSASVISLFAGARSSRRGRQKWERHSDRKWQRETHTETERDRECDRERDREWQKVTERQTERQKERDRERDRRKDTERCRERQKESGSNWAIVSSGLAQGLCWVTGLEDERSLVNKASSLVNQLLCLSHCWWKDLVLR